VLELMGMDDVVAGGEKERKEKGWKQGEGGGVAEKKRTRVQKLPARPLESIWTPCSAKRSQGD